MGTCSETICKHGILYLSIQHLAWLRQGKQKCGKNSDFWTYALKGTAIGHSRSSMTLTISSLLAYLKTINMFCRHSYLLQYQLRQRSHNKIMISKTADLNDRDFIVRMLHKDSYYFFLNFYCFATFFLQLFYSFLTASVQLRMSTVYKRIWIWIYTSQKFAGQQSNCFAFQLHDTHGLSAFSIIASLIKATRALCWIVSARDVANVVRVSAHARGGFYSLYYTNKNTFTPGHPAWY